MKIVFSFRLSCVKWLYGIGVIVAEYAGTVDGPFEILFFQRLHQMIIPVANLVRSAAPVIVAHMQHMVFKILEFLVRCLGAFHI